MLQRQATGIFGIATAALAFYLGAASLYVEMYGRVRLSITLVQCKSVQLACPTAERMPPPCGAAAVLCCLCLPSPLPPPNCFQEHVPSPTLQEILPVFPLTWSKVPLSKRRAGPMATRKELLALAPELASNGKHTVAPELASNGKHASALAVAGEEGLAAKV